MYRKKLIVFIKTILLTVFILLRNGSAVGQEENLNVLERWIEWSDSKNMLIHHLNDQAFALLDERDKEIAAFKKKDWIKRQKKVKDLLMGIVGPFPEKTPLNAKVTGIVKKDGYRIEKILYESMPGFHVTGCLFIPERIYGKRPAILNVIGHTGIAFRAEGYQRMILHLVQKGFIVFAIDPIGQGERIQYYDIEKGGSVIGGSVSEHSYFGNQCFMTGVSPARYFIWDGIRAIDYLVSRSEVDPDRIGVTGISGGGTLTSYISAFDERVKASAPTCYITGYRRLLESIGPQDAEQNLYHAIKHGITHADFLVARAPKPTMIVATTRDFFSIQGARETYDEVSKAYKAFGKEDNIFLTEDDDVHTLSPKNNEATVAFFQKYLDLPGDPSVGNIRTLPPEELNVTTTGQLSTSVGGESVFSLNKKEAEKLTVKIDASRRNLEAHLSKVKLKATELSGFISPSEKINSIFRGRYQREGYSVEMYALHGEGDYIIPLLLFVPKNGSKFQSVIYMHPEGKIVDATPGGKIEQLVKKGYMVAAPDVLGVGETEDTSYGSFYLSLMIGRSIVGIQAGDVIRVADFLKSREDVDKIKISAIAFDEMCPTLLHAAAFDNSIKSVTLVNPLISYRSVVMNKYYDTGLSKYFVAGALAAYDLPDLAAVLAPGKLNLINMRDGESKFIDIDKENSDIELIKTAWQQKNAGRQLSIVKENSEEKIFGQFLKYIE